MNDLVKFGGANVPANPEDLAKGLAGLSSGLQGTTSGKPLVRMLKTGTWVYGPENIEIQEGSRWAVNPYSIMHGLACWGDSVLHGESMVAFNQAPPRVDDMQDFGYEWAQQLSMDVKCLDGDDAGLTGTYKGTSYGLRNAVKALIDQIIAQSQSDPEHIVPVIELYSDFYNHKKHGQTFFPVIDIVEWLTMAGPDASEEDAEPEAVEEDEIDTPPPKKAKRRGKSNVSKAKPADDAAEKPATTSRRRRRAS